MSFLLECLTWRQTDIYIHHMKSSPTLPGQKSRTIPRRWRTWGLVLKHKSPPIPTNLARRSFGQRTLWPQEGWTRPEDRSTPHGAFPWWALLQREAVTDSFTPLWTQLTHCHKKIKTSLSLTKKASPDNITHTKCEAWGFLRQICMN